MIAHRSNCRVTILSNTSQPLTLTPAYWSSLRAMCRDKYPRDIPPRSFTLRPFGIGKNIAVCYGFPAYLETRGRDLLQGSICWTHLPNSVNVVKARLYLIWACSASYRQPARMLRCRNTRVHRFPPHFSPPIGHFPPPPP